MEDLLRRYILEVLDGFTTPGLRRADAPTNTVSGASVRPGGAIDHLINTCPKCGAEAGFNIDCFMCMQLDEHTRAPTKLAACVLIVSDDGKILAVSRKDNPSDFGMPGGKVDPGEEPIEAAARELEEETGLHVHNLRLVFDMFDGDSACYTFVGQVDGEINTDESGVVRWVDPHVLLKGSFSRYNKALLTKLGML